jgi:hypothetical protein
MENKEREIREARNRQDILIGFIASLVYVLLGWGIDTFQLAQAHYIFPWLKMVISAIPSIIIITGAAWLGTKINNIVLKGILWIIAATALSLIISYVSFQGTERIYGLLLPKIRSQLSYMATGGIASRLFVIIVMTNILFILGGLFIDTASESIITASSVFGWILPVIFCLAFFGGAGFTADSNFNTELRENVMSINQQIEEVSKMNINDLSLRDQRLVQRFTRLDVNLQGPRKLLVASFDESFSQAQVLIDFSGTWTECLSLNGRVGSCQRVGE